MKFYNQLAKTYDYFIDWEKRMERENPFFQHVFHERMATSILDLGCGTGGYGIHWANMGYHIVGIDSAKEMIHYAKQRAEESVTDIDYHCLRITDFTSTIQEQFDAVVCLGNTLPHLLLNEEIDKMFNEVAASLKPTGVAIFHLHNFQRLLDIKKRDFPVISRTVDEVEYLFVRSYDYSHENLTFNFVTATKKDDTWQSRSIQSIHRPWIANQLIDQLRENGFNQIMLYGGYDFSEFSPEKSENLILVCEMGEDID